MTDKPKVSLEHYKKLIDSTIYEYEDKWGFIDYEEASDFYEDMEAFNDDIRIMIDNEQYRDAFQLSLYIYQEWVRLLKQMRKIEGGKELSRQIAEDWRIRYKNRRAMMDELKGL